LHWFLVEQNQENKAIVQVTTLIDVFFVARVKQVCRSAMAEAKLALPNDVDRINQQVCCCELASTAAPACCQSNDTSNSVTRNYCCHACEVTLSFIDMLIALTYLTLTYIRSILCQHVQSSSSRMGAWNITGQQCPCSVQKRFSRDHCCRGRSKPSCGLWGRTLGEN